MKKIIKASLIASQALMLSTSKVLAVLEEGDGGGGGGSAKDIFGTIEAPQGIAAYGNLEGGGLLLFISNIIRISTVIAGVWVMINFILAGWKYVTSAGDSKAPAEAASMMTHSLIGLALIVGAYTIAGVIGLVFFGDATYIISPTFTGV